MPEYLGQVKEEIRRENEMIDAYVLEMGRAQGAVEEAGEVRTHGSLCVCACASRIGFDAGTRPGCRFVL